MPVPTSYTETELATYMHTELGTHITAFLAMTNPASYANAIIHTLIGMGVTNISEVDVDEVPELLAVSRVMAIKTALILAAGKYDFGTDSQILRRDQVFTHLNKALSIAENDALGVGADLAGYEMESIPMSDPHNPYALISDEFRVTP